MPTMAWVVGAVTLTLLLAALWVKVIKPLSLLHAHVNELLPLSHEIVKAHRATPQFLDVLNKIVQEFKSDSGSTLKDQMNRLERAALANAASAEKLSIRAQAVKELAAEDRAKLEEIDSGMSRLVVQVTKIERKLDGPQ